MDNAVRSQLFRARQVALGLFGLFLLVPLFVEFAAWRGNLFDDAYIYLRYAENIQRGCLLEWNCDGGRVEGFTSPAYLALLVGVGAWGVALPDAATWIGLLSWASALAAFIIMPLILKRHLGDLPVGIVSVLMGCALASDQFIAINAASGMEGGLVCLALSGTTWLAFHPRRLAITAPWLVLVRPELGLVTLLQPIVGKDFFKLAAITAGVVFAGVTFVRLGIFHDVVPNTFWAKSGGTADHLAHGWRYLTSCYGEFPLALLGWIGLLSKRRPLRFLSALLGTWSLYFLWSGGDFYGFARLFAFLTPLAYFVGICVAFEFLPTQIPALWKTALVALAVVLAVGVGQKIRDTYEPGEGFTNVTRWESTGKFLNRCFPGASVAAVPIGALGYFSKAPLFDLVGLVDPKVAIDGQRTTGKDFVVGHERYDPVWALAMRPGVVFVDAGRSEPFDPGKPVDVLYIAEQALLDLIRETQAPYLVFTPQVSPGVYQFLLVRRDVAVAAAGTSAAQCFPPAS